MPAEERGWWSRGTKGAREEEDGSHISQTCDPSHDNAILVEDGGACRPVVYSSGCWTYGCRYLNGDTSKCKCGDIYSGGGSMHLVARSK